MKSELRKRFHVFFLLLILPCTLFGYETVVESDEVRYDGNLITLIGNVTVENAIGKVSASMATLKKDSEKRTQIDFPWIELQANVILHLAQGGILHCETVFIDYTKMTSFFTGKPQLIYSDSSMGEVYADKAQIDYREVNGNLEATQVTLYDNVRLVNTSSAENSPSQYALADIVYYFPQEQLTILEGKSHQVLFYDKARDMQLTAKTVRAQRDPVTKKETVQGIGDVRFVFGPEELDKIKNRFQISLLSKFTAE